MIPDLRFACPGYKRVRKRGFVTQPIIDAAGIDKFYGAHQALFAVSLAVAPGEFVALVGPSGCGKTSLLKILAGFEHPSRGRLTIEGRDMNGVPASARPTRMVFQKLALWPHKTVADNIAFPLRIAGRPKAEIEQKVRAMMELMHLRPAYADRLPGQLSGGEQQRVALARSMVSSPSVLLLDEPLSALDAKLRKSLQSELKRLHRSLGTTFVHVTHDLEEAMMLADRICVMRAGRVVQVGRPADIYYRPVDGFVAGFIGETNLLPVEVLSVGAAGADYRPAFFSDAVGRLSPGCYAPELKPGPAVMTIRPELARLLPAGTEADCSLEGQVEEFFVKGASIQYRVAVPRAAAPFVFEIPGTATPPVEVGAPVRLGWSRADAFVFQEAAP